MAVTPKNTFDFAIARGKHQLALYDILHDSRQRGGVEWIGKEISVK